MPQIQTSAQRRALIKLIEVFLRPSRQIPGSVSTSLLLALRVAMDPSGTRQRLALRSCYRAVSFINFVLF